MPDESPIPTDTAHTTNRALDTFADGGDFDLAWEEAQHLEARTDAGGSSSRAIAMALPVAAAAVLGLVAWTALPPGIFTAEPDIASGSGVGAPEDADAQEDVPPDPPLDVDIRIGAGHMALYTPKGPVESIDIVLPDVLAIRTTGQPEQLAFHGIRPGRTDVIVKLEGVDAPTILSTQVTVEPHSPNADQTLAIEAGTYEVLQLGRLPSVVAIVDPDVAQVQSLGDPHRILLHGLRPGTTDILVGDEDTQTVYTVHIGVDPVSALASPPAERTLYVGQAVTVPLNGATQVSISDPDVIRSRTGGDAHVVISGLRPGRSDVLMNGPNGIRHLRFDVQP